MNARIPDAESRETASDITVCILAVLAIIGLVYCVLDLLGSL